jgi:predicted O-methyltransferase YrrM
VKLPANVETIVQRCVELMRPVPGWLDDSEARFLALALVASPAEGANLEIGSFKGRSTVVLGSASKQFGLGKIVAVDPHMAETIPDDAVRNRSSFEDFLETIRTSGLEDVIDVVRAYSRDLASHWDRPLRFLWIDGDHSYAGVEEDFRLFLPHLADGAVVLLHDGLHPMNGPIRVFLNKILDSDDFGPAGFCKSIGWAQYRPGRGTACRRQRQMLARRVRWLLPFTHPPESRRTLWIRLCESIFDYLRRYVPNDERSPSDLIALLESRDGRC